jgi:uncharacterized protein
MILLVAAACGGGQQVSSVKGNCDSQHPDICRDLAARQDSGVDGAKNAERAAELYRVAAEGYLGKCNVDDGLACAQLAQLYLHGRGVVQDPNEAVRLDERACMLGYSSKCK